MIEIYNEEARDLLSKAVDKKPLKIREKPRQGFISILAMRFHFICKLAFNMNWNDCVLILCTSSCG